MQCPRCGATAPDTMSRCGRCDSPLQAAAHAAHEHPAAAGYDGPPPLQHAPLGSSIYEGGGGPPVQAFVESAEDPWRPLGQQQFPPSTPSTTQPSTTRPTAPPPSTTPPSTAPPAYGGPGGEVGEPTGEATQMWTPPPAFSDPPGGDAAVHAAAQTPPPNPVPQPPRHAPPDWHAPQPPLAQPSMPSPVPPYDGLPHDGLPHDGLPHDGLPYDGLPHEFVPRDESVAERTMAVWFSDPPSAGGPADRPVAGSQTPAYGSAAPPQIGQGRNETAILPDVPAGRQPGGWSPEAWQQPEPGGFGPGGEPGAAPPRRPASGPSKPLIFTVTGLVAVALVAAVVVLWPDGGGDKTSGSNGPTQAAAQTPATSTTTSSVAHREAVLVNRVLNASAASRGELARALTAAGTCKGLPTAIAGFERVATQRRAQIAHTRALKVGRLPNGVRLRQTLGRSIQYSLAADQALLTWARGRQGCHGKPKRDANFRRAGGQLSAQASAAKSQFATLWAPVARQHHLPARTANSF